MPFEFAVAATRPLRLASVGSESLGVLNTLSFSSFAENGLA